MRGSKKPVLKNFFKKIFLENNFWGILNEGNKKTSFKKLFQENIFRIYFLDRDLMGDQKNQF